MTQLPNLTFDRKGNPMPTRHHVVTIDHFQKANNTQRLEVMRRTINVLESTILTMTSQLTQVKETHAELLDMVTILIEGESGK